MAIHWRGPNGSLFTFTDDSDENVIVSQTPGVDGDAQINVADLLAFATYVRRDERVDWVMFSKKPDGAALLEVCAEARKAWSERHPHDDFRFGMPSLMALGRALEEEIAKRVTKPEDC